MSATLHRFLAAALSVTLAGPVWVHASSAPAAADDEPPEQAAYLSMVRADAARDAGLWADARHYYQRALDRFETLARERPEVMPRSVAYRMAYCREEIDAIRNRIAMQSAAADVAAAGEITALRQRVEELETLLAAAEQRIRALTRRIEDDAAGEGVPLEAP